MICHSRRECGLTIRTGQTFNSMAVLMKFVIAVLPGMCMLSLVGTVSGQHCTALTTGQGGAEALCYRHYNATLLPTNFTGLARIAVELNGFASLIQTPVCHSQLPLFVCASFLPICYSSGAVGHYALRPCKDFCLEMRSACSNLFMDNNFIWPSQFDCSNATRYPVTAHNQTKCLRRPALSPTQMATSTAPSTTVNATLSRSRLCSSGYYFEAERRSFVAWWIGIWSVLCLISSSVTVATFIMDHDRFNYPEKPIVFLSLSYSVYSIVFIARLITGSDDIVCAGPKLVDVGTISGPCTIVALVLYFSWMASYSWWLILTLTWLLAAGFHWGTEAIAKHSTHFHLFAWGAPAVKTLVLVAMERVDADELARVCSVGNSDKSALLGFVLVPISVYLAVGTLFIITGIASLIRIRTLMKHGGKSTQKLEQLIVRIGILSVFYTGPASVVLGIFAYEYADRDNWSSYCTESTCKPACTADAGPACDHPIFAVFIIKYFMLLVVGVTSSVWIWSGKTVTSWKRATRHLCRKNRGAADLELEAGSRAGRRSTDGQYRTKAASLKNGSTHGSIHSQRHARGTPASLAPVHSVTQV